MKKRKVLLFSLIIALCVLVGFTIYPVLTNKTFEKNELSSTTENNVANGYSNSDATKEDVKKVLSSVIKPEKDVVSQELSSAESISIEDKAVMSEIAKYVETSIEFKFNKQESINDKSYNLTFSEVDSTTDYKRIIYKNSIGDEFAYNTDNGKLRCAVMDSAVTEKTVASIDKTTAQKIAAEYVATKCNIEEYTMNFFQRK